MIGGQWAGIEGAVEALVASATLVSRDEEVSRAMLKGAALVVERAAENTRAVGAVETGALAESFHAARDKGTESGGGVVTVVIGPRRMAPHSWLLRFFEFGTSKMSARPILTPAWESSEREFVATVVEALRDGFRRAVASRRSR
jgi:HK97 gp10 family phage protein